MAYLTINGVDYLVRQGSVRGRWDLIENRRRAIDGSLLVDLIAEKRRVDLEITGRVADGRFFTIAQADTLMALLRGANVSVSGDSGTFTARASGIGWVDVQDFRTSPPLVYRHVSCTLEAV